MTTYYVRKSGNNGNSGTSPSLAKLTIQAAVNIATSAGDIVYVGSGIYRELVTSAASGSYGSEIKLIGDIDGVQTGDPGPVVVTAFNSETGAQTRTQVMSTGGYSHLYFSRFTCIGGDDTFGIPYSMSESDNITLEDMSFLSPMYGAMSIIAGTPTADKTYGLTVRRCYFEGRARSSGNSNSVQEVNLKIVYENCIWFFGANQNSTQSACISHVCYSGSTYAITGIKAYNCLFYGTWTGISSTSSFTTTTKIEVYNSIFHQLQTGLWAGASGQIVSDYNAFFNVGAFYSNVTAGSNDIQGGTSYLGEMHDHILRMYFGWSPYRLGEPIYHSNGQYTSHLIGAASATYAPSDDFFGSSRPLGSADDIGAVETKKRAVKETTTKRTGTSGLKINGTGWHSIKIPVPASSTTISVYAQYDSNYGAGTKPQLVVTNIPGVADQTDTMTSGSGTWEQLSVNFTPTQAGLVTAKLVSSAASTGNAFFDDLG